MVVYGTPEYQRMQKMNQLDGSIRVITFADGVDEQKRDLLDLHVFHLPSEMGKTTCPRCNRVYYYTKNEYYNLGVMVFCSLCVIHLPVEIPEEDLARFMNKVRGRKRIESPEYEKARSIILQRDKHQCVNCDNTDYLQVVHIDKNHENNKSTNLVTLCPKCRFDGQLQVGNKRFVKKLQKIAKEREVGIG